MRLVIYRTRRPIGGGYRWRLVADNGRAIANGGQGYSRRIDMVHAVEAALAGRLTKRRNATDKGQEFLRVVSSANEFQRIPVEDRT